jgi:hypothetical protein
MHYMFCISGFAGAGKDECAGRLVKEHHATQTGLADPGKRHMADAYGFTEQQLFGPSPFRNAGDVRIPKNTFYEYGLEELLGQVFPHHIVAGKDPKYAIDTKKKYWVYATHFLDDRRPYLQREDGWLIFVQEGDPEFWLSPREALQQYLEKMNQLDVYTWIRKGVADQLMLASPAPLEPRKYDRMKGLVFGENGPARNHQITCFADFRHIPEVQYVRDLAARNDQFKPILIRVKRPSIPVPPYNHRSETEQVKIRDTAFDFIVHNDKDLPHLYGQMDSIVTRVLDEKVRVKHWSREYVLPDRKPEEGYAP